MKFKGIKSAKKLKEIYNRIAAEPPTQWPVEDRCKAIAILKDSLLASKKPGADYIIGGKQTLHTLLKSTTLSTAWQDHCLHAASRLAALLAEHTPPDDYIKTWLRKTKAEKMKFYRDLITLQSRLLSLEGLAFSPTTVKLTGNETCRGSFTWDPGHPMDPARSKIAISKKGIKSPSFDSIGTIWHEQLHSIMYQLGAHFQNGTIAPTHPFYEDAKLVYHRVRQCAHGTMDLGESLYKRDTEEALCLRSENRLIRHYQNHRFFTARPQIGHQIN